MLKYTRNRINKDMNVRNKNSKLSTNVQVSADKRKVLIFNL